MKRTPREEAIFRCENAGHFRSDEELPNALLAIASALVYIGDQFSHLTKRAPDFETGTPKSDSESNPAVSSG